jgi:hypothetical protein
MLNHAEVGIRYLKIMALRYCGVFPLHLSCDVTAVPVRVLEPFLKTTHVVIS